MSTRLTIHRYTAGAVTPARMRQAPEPVTELTAQAPGDLAETDRQLCHRAGHLRHAADRIATALGATDPAALDTLNNLGEVQGYGLDTDRLIGVRHQQATRLRELVSLLPGPTPAPLYRVVGAGGPPPDDYHRPGRRAGGLDEPHRDRR